MTANMIIKFFETYGWIMTLLATSGIILVGCLKAIGLFSKLKSGAKKYVYFLTACVVSIISCTIYLCVNKSFVWADWGVTVVFIIAYTMALYALYENTGIRALLKKILFNPIKNMLHRLQTSIMTKTLSQEQSINIARGLGEDILTQLVSEMTNLDKNSMENGLSTSLEVASDVVEETKQQSVSKYKKSNFFS